MHSSNDAQTTATSDIMDYDDDNLILPENGVYTTEIYPEAYLPSSASSSEFSSADSSPQLTGVVDNMILDHKDLHMLTLPPTPARIIRKPSKTIINRRNSVLLDVIEEEEPSAVNEEKVAGVLANGQPSSTIAAAAVSSSSQVHCQRVE